MCDARHGIDSHMAWIVEEFARHIVQFKIQPIRSEWRPRQARATHHHAIEGEIQARLAEGSNYLILVVIQRARATIYYDAIEHQELNLTPTEEC